jgi:hypothetical protein
MDETEALDFLYDFVIFDFVGEVEAFRRMGLV